MPLPSRLDPPNSEALLDPDQAVVSLILGWKIGRSRLHRDDLGLVDPVGVPFVDDGGGPTESTITNPSSVATAPTGVS